LRGSSAKKQVRQLADKRSAPLTMHKLILHFFNAITLNKIAKPKDFPYLW